MKLNFPIHLQRAGRVTTRCRRAFSLLEVMIAGALFFMAVFAILGLVSQSLRNARRLQRPQVDASPVLAIYASTNSLEEGTYYGDLSTILGENYRNYRWTAEIREVETNKLFSVQCIVQANGRQEIISDLSTLLYRPQSPAGSLDGDNFTHK